MNEEREVREALQRLAPHPNVPDDLLGNARRRRNRRRTGVFTGAGLAAVVLVAAIAPQLSLPFVASDNEAMSANDAAETATEFAAQESDGQDSGGQAHEEIARPSLADNTYASLAAEASQQLAWEIIAHADEANPVVSPSSLSLSLAMAAEGARGDSLASIDAALGIAGDERAEAFGALRDSLAAYEVEPDDLDLNEPPEQPAVHQANRVVTIDATAEPVAVERLDHPLGATLQESSYPEAQEELDSWVRQHTAGLIESSGIEVTPDTSVVLQDALLFAAGWRTPFTEELPHPFRTPEGTTEADMMRGVTEVQRAEGERWLAVRLAYDDALAADIILPQDGLTPGALTAEEFALADRALDASSPEEVEVTMPSVDLTAKTDLLGALPGIDLTDLSGIVEDGTVEQWVQQVRLQVSPRGTVGAAATELVVGQSATIAPPGQSFTVDRPYVFRVFDTRTDWPLFLAVIADPTTT